MSDYIAGGLVGLAFFILALLPQFPNF